MVDAPTSICDASPLKPASICASYHHSIRRGLPASANGVESSIGLNSPYGPQLGLWLGKLADHGCGTAISFARTETRAFVENVWPRASGILFIYGRLHFYRPDGIRAKANSGAPSVLISYGEKDAEILRTCGIEGKFVRLGGAQ